MLRALVPDRFVLLLLAMVALASVLPISGRWTGAAQAVATAAVVLLFFLNGVRLPRAELVSALRGGWLHGAALFYCFAVMPLIGLALAGLTQSLLPPLIALGFLFCGVLPSTVQSATAASRQAGGHVAASIVMAALLNLVGVAAAPLLFALMSGGDVTFAPGGLMRVVLVLLLPFALGQMARPMLARWAAARGALLTRLDRSAIAIAVYVAFSAAVTGGLWQALAARDMAVLGGGIALMLALGHGGAWALGRMLGRTAGLDRASAISLFFAGSQKSIAVGAPMASALFAPAAAAGLLVVILFYHMAQLILAAWLAPRLRAGGDVI